MKPIKDNYKKNTHTQDADRVTTSNEEKKLEN